MKLWKTLATISVVAALAVGSLAALADDTDHYIYNSDGSCSDATGAAIPCPDNGDPGGGDPNGNNTCPQQFEHSFTVGPTSRVHLDGRTGVALGGFKAFDTASAFTDCNADGVPDGGDRDPDAGVGGVFLPQGPAASSCGFVPHHTGNGFIVSDTLGQQDYFVVAGNDASGSTACESDGAITPDVDPSDWFEVCKGQCAIPGVFTNTQAAGCPCTIPEVAGGDGGLFVFVDPTLEAGSGLDSAQVGTVFSGTVFQFQAPPGFTGPWQG